MKKITTPDAILIPTGNINFSKDGFMIEFRVKHKDGSPESIWWSDKVFGHDEMRNIAKIAVETLVSIGVNWQQKVWENQGKI